MSRTSRIPKRLPTFGELGRVHSNLKPEPSARDWHAARSTDEPRCAADQWRTRDRSEVIYFSEMTDSHLGHCIRFASTKLQHKSRLAGLLEEQHRRRDYEQV